MGYGGNSQQMVSPGGVQRVCNPATGMCKSFNPATGQKAVHSMHPHGAGYNWGGGYGGGYGGGKGLYNAAVPQHQMSGLGAGYNWGKGLQAAVNLGIGKQRKF